jgi:hypothetical protein
LSGPRGYRSIPKGAFVPGGWYGYLVKLSRQPRICSHVRRTRRAGLAGRSFFRSCGRPALHVETRRGSPAHNANLRRSPAEPCIDADKNGRCPRFSGASCARRRVIRLQTRPASTDLQRPTRPTVAALRTRRRNGANSGEDTRCGTLGRRRAATDLRRRPRPKWPTSASAAPGRAPGNGRCAPRSHPSVRRCCSGVVRRRGLTCTCPPARRAVLALPYSLHALILCLIACE